MRQMEALLDGLQSFAATLVSTYESHIDSTRLCVRTPRLTVESLPNEIIHHIVKDAFVDYPSPIAASLIRYSHICSKFRDVILESPSLWSSITLYPSMHTSLIQTIIRRSSTLGLNVDIDITHDLYREQPVRDTYGLSGLSTMFKQNHRWRNLLLTLNDDESAKIILKHFPRANFTSVRSLEVADYSGLETDLFEKWLFPRLEELFWDSQTFPPLGMATQMLHHCILSLGQSASHLISIATFLNAASGLRTLELELAFPDDYEPAEFQKIRLSHLERLEDYSRHDGWFGTYAPLLKGILCPGLKHLTLVAGTPADYYALTKDMRGRYPVLTSFTLQIKGRRDAKQVFSFEDILCSLPSSIKSLEIELDSGDLATLYASQRDNNVPRNLCISYPNLTDLDFVNNLHKDRTMLEENFYAKLSEVLKCFRVSLSHFEPGVGRWDDITEMELEKDNAMMTLQHAGVLSVVDLTLAS